MAASKGEHRNHKPTWQSVKAAIEPLLQASQKDKTIDTMILTINNNKTPFNFKKNHARATNRQQFHGARDRGETEQRVARGCA